MIDLHLSWTETKKHSPDNSISALSVHGELSKNSLISETNGRVTIKSGTFKAIQPFNYSDWWSISCDSEKELLNHFMDAFKLTTGRKRLHGNTRAALSALIANMTHSGRIKKPVLYCRRTSTHAIRLTIELIDFMAQQQMLHTTIGKANQFEENQSWFVPSAKFNLLAERERIRIAISKDDSFLLLRDENKESVTIKKTRANRLELHALSAPVVAYNHTWLSHSATESGRELIPFMRRIFSRSLSLGGRWYGSGLSHLQLTKAERQKVLIDDCQTIEPDYKALHYSLLYSMVGIELSSDPYTVEGYSRKTMKLASLVLLNSNDLGRFKANITKSGTPKAKAMAEREPNHSLLEGFIQGMPDGINGGDLLAALKAKHAPIAHYFGSKDIGLKLQRLDSDIMASAVHSLAALNIPVLPVHDSIRCRIIDKTTVTEAMKTAYKKHTGYTPIIDF